MVNLLAPLVLLLSANAGQDLTGLEQIREGKPRRISSTADDWRNSNVDFRPIRPGETLRLADLKGPGTIKRIWLTILPSEPGYSRLLTIRMYWDGEQQPSVECPLGDFFGVGHGVDARYESAPVRASSDGKARSCVWPMPFHKSARIEVTNDGTEATWGFYYTIDWEEGPVSRDAATFHASYRQSFPTPLGSDFTIADIEGQGHYVGTVLSVRSNTPGWWGEGDDFFYLDGEREPSIKGTGLEDYFGEAWGLRATSGLTTGVSLWEGGQPGARTTCYRWHTTDPVRFKKSLKVEIEHKGVEFGKEGNNNERRDDYSAVAFWYQKGPHKPYPPLPAGHDRLPFDYRKMIQGESLIHDAKATKGDISEAKANGLSKNSQLEWSGADVGDALSLPFTVDQDGSYSFLLLTTNRWDSGIFEVLVDDRSFGQIDLHSGGWSPYQENVLEFIPLKSGAHTLRLKAVGRNPRSSGHWLGLDGFVVHKRPF